MIHCQPGVIGQRRQAGYPRRIACFEDGVLYKGKPGFLWFDVAEFADRTHMHSVAEHGLQLLELAGVMAGQHQFVEEHYSSGKTSWLKSKLIAGAPAGCTFRLKRRVSCESKGN